MRPPAALTPLLAAVLSALLLGPRDGRARLQSGFLDRAAAADGGEGRPRPGLRGAVRLGGRQPARFRKWYADEPSCGNEVCVVLYHQPSAPAGPGGPYLFQWNDDRCHMKNNFICKYSDERTTAASTGWGPGRRGEGPELLTPTLPGQSRRDANETLKETKEAGLNILSILIPSISLLLLLAATAAVGCVWIGVKRRREGAGPRPKKQRAGAPLPAPSSPNLEVYNVIRKQDEADLAGARPAPKNISFLPRPGTGPRLGPPGAGHPEARGLSEAGLGTPVSAESGFVTNDIYELSHDQRGRSKQSAWVENDIYGYEPDWQSSNRPPPSRKEK
ncbi:layilin [Ornithorhynchus anatinus]|uniref:layilin n=1 Tax=Ornithorhynchus anatinus TaxID=9258 RepID=UPI0010A88336|nr:layilin [Ornithorhynchus anatinus]